MKERIIIQEKESKIIFLIFTLFFGFIAFNCIAQETSKGSQVKIYYNSDWQVTKYESEASYYRIINYFKGKISGPVKDYYISGKVQMEGYYSDYYAEEGHRNGLFTWYYENGQKSESVNYINNLRDGRYYSYYTDGKIKIDCNFKNGKLDGKYLSYYSNGSKNEEVNYYNGKKEGCHCLWDENGLPIQEGGYSWKYFLYYKNGERDIYNRDCPLTKASEGSYESENNIEKLKFENGEPFTDIRDGKTYKTVIMGTQVWMAENLAFNANGGCWAYNNIQSNVAKYGYLYTWYCAKNICPSGWHLPDVKEWGLLINYIGSSSAAYSLKSKSFWTKGSSEVTNRSGFSAVPAGYYIYDNNGSFYLLGDYVAWWSTIEDDFNKLLVWTYSMRGYSSVVDAVKSNKNNGHSVRCICDKSSSEIISNKIEVKTADNVNLFSLDKSTIVDEMPSFPGGDDALRTFIRENLIYPKLAVETGIEGSVYVSFVLNSIGEITDPIILRGIGGGCDEEAIRLVKSMPKWNPAENKGNALSVKINMPIKFNIIPNK